MKKYYTQDHLNDLGKRRTPEVQAESERGWADLVRDVEAAIARGEDPESEVGQQLAERRQRLIDLFTGVILGSRRICKSSRRTEQIGSKRSRNR